MPKRQPKQVVNRPERAAEVGVYLWDKLGLSKLERDRHVRACLLCKTLVSECASSGEDDYLTEAVGLVKKHRAEHKNDKIPNGKGCAYDGCVLHEEVPRELAIEMIRLGGGDEPWRDIRGIQVSCIPLVVRKEDHPEGFDMKQQDITHRFFKNLPTAAGDVYVRLGPKKTMIHLCATPAYVSRHEDPKDAPSIADIIRVNKEVLPKITEWILAKYSGLKKYAESELAGEKAKEEKKP